MGGKEQKKNNETQKNQAQKYKHKHQRHRLRTTPIGLVLGQASHNLLYWVLWKYILTQLAWVDRTSI